MLSIDNEAFYLGGYYSSDAPVETAHTVFVRNAKIGKLLEAYWNNLWQSAKPLNEGKRINWDELNSLAGRVGMDESELKVIVLKWKSEIERQRHRTH